MEAPRTKELLQMVTLNLRQVSSLCKFRKACFLYTFCSHLDIVKSYNLPSPTSQVRPQSHHTKDCMTRKSSPLGGLMAIPPSLPGVPSPWLPDVSSSLLYSHSFFILCWVMLLAEA